MLAEVVRSTDLTSTTLGAGATFAQLAAPLIADGNAREAGAKEVVTLLVDRALCGVGDAETIFDAGEAVAAVSCPGPTITHLSDADVVAAHLVRSAILIEHTVGTTEAVRCAALVDGAVGIAHAARRHPWHADLLEATCASAKLRDTLGVGHTGHGAVGHVEAHIGLDDLAEPSDTLLLSAALLIGGALHGGRRTIAGDTL